MASVHGYRVLRLLGEGGFGKTWLVEAEGRPGRPLVLKRLNLQWKENEKARQLFQREAEVLRRLRHGALPRVVDWFVDDDGMALVQTFVEGTDLERLLAGGRRFQEDEVADILARILEVLDYLHTVQPSVVHRDVKPGNLVLHEDGRVTLIDFGAVKEIAAGPRGTGTTVILSEGYSPPEQSMGHVGPESDLYALGATALHLLTGVLPAQLYDVSTARFRWSHRASCSAGLGALLDRLTEPLPADRPASAREALEALRASRPRLRQERPWSLPLAGLFRPEDFGDGQDLLAAMDREQEAIARNLGEGHRVVRGVAGSGKTMILVFRARLLSGLFPRRRFLVTCYTRSLAGQLREMLAACLNVRVAHLDRLMAETIRQAGLPFPGYDDDSGDRVAGTALQALAEGAGERFDGVLLDEAQDFSTQALQFAVRLLREGRDDLLVVADAAQNIFRRRLSWGQAGIRAIGRTRVLRVNYRNTREILQFAFDYLVEGAPLGLVDFPDPEDENSVVPPEAARRSGPEPLFIERATDAERVEAAAERVAVWVRRRCAGPRSIGVLYPSSRTVGIDLARRLVSLGVPHFWLADPDNRQNRDLLTAAREPVVLTSVHSAKGLEFDQVVVCGLHHPDFEAPESRKLAYVAMTRAREELVVVG